MLQLLDQSWSHMCTELMRSIYFNVNVPRNINWCIAYPKNEEGAVVFNYENNQFVRQFTVKVIDEKFTNMMMLIKPLIEEIQNDDVNAEKDKKLSKRQIDNISRYQRTCGGDISDAADKAIFESVRALAFKNKSIPMTSWKEQGFKGNHLSLKF